MLSEKFFEDLKEKEIVMMQLEEIQKKAFLRGTYIVRVTHFDGRKISENSFDNYNDAIVFYDNACKEYQQYASVRFHIDFTLM